jgi:excisionase family DNA binding protein
MTEYRVSQSAELLGVSVDTVRRWADTGRLKTTVGPGGGRHFDGSIWPVLRIPEFPDTWSQVSVHVSVGSKAA